MDSISASNPIISILQTVRHEPDVNEVNIEITELTLLHSSIVEQVGASMNRRKRYLKRPCSVLHQAYKSCLRLTKSH